MAVDWKKLAIEQAKRNAELEVKLEYVCDLVRRSHYYWDDALNFAIPYTSKPLYCEHKHERSDEDLRARERKLIRELKERAKKEEE